MTRAGGTRGARTLLGVMSALLFAGSLVGCAAIDERVAQAAKVDLVGMSALDVQTCLGLPDQRLVTGRTTLLTYFANATRTFGMSAGLVSLSFGGYCHATVRIAGDRVTGVTFSGDTSSLMSHDAACAPIVKSCLRRPPE
jgi:hypothetical protein